MYVSILPNVFPYQINGSPEKIRELVTDLLSEYRTDVPNGSSFAVTVDGHKDTWNLWMSETSAKFLFGDPPFERYKNDG